MKAAFLSHKHPTYLKALQWGKLITISGGAQVLVQGASLLCGLLVVRLLPTQEYALYTIANTMLGTMTILADGGIFNGVLALGGKVWQDEKQLGDVINTGLYMRRKFAIISLIVAIPLLSYLLIHQGAGWLTTLLILLSVIPAFISALSDTLLEVMPKLYQDINFLQKNQLLVSILRLLLSTITLFIFPAASLAILCSGIPRIYGNSKLKTKYNVILNKGLYRKDIQQEIEKTVKRILPSALFYCFSGQITIWLISILGNSESVAEIGALGRITSVFTIFNTLFAALIIPRYARLNQDKQLLIKNYFIILIISTITLSLCCLLTFLFSHQLLLVLGKKYYGLNNELFLYVLATCIGLLSNIHSALSSSRGWFINPWIIILSESFVIIIGIFIFNLSNLREVIFYNLYLFSFYLLQYFIYFFYCIKRIHNKS